MKKILLAALMPLLAGCIQEDLSNCISKPIENVTIRFNLITQNQFIATINRVELFIFNDAGKQVSRHTILQSELAQFAGRRLTLDPGNYTVIAWANASPLHTQFFTNEQAHYDDHAKNYLLTAIAAGGIVEDGDPLYWGPVTKGAPFSLTVPVEGYVDVVIRLRNAHVKVEVTVEGYDHLSSRTGANPLMIELTQITSRYSLQMEPHGDNVSYLHDAPNIDPVNKIFNTTFNVPVFDGNTPTMVRITNSDGVLIVSAISLRELLKDLNKVEIAELAYLPIRVIFTEKDGNLQVTVKVDLPEWGEDIVKPNI